MDIKNKDLIPVINFLSKLSLPRKVARANSKFLSSIEKSLKSLQDSENELVKSFDGEIVDGQIKIDADKKDSFKKEHDELLDETVSVKSSYKEQFSIFKKYFEDWDGEVNPTDVVGMNALYDALEDNDDSEQD